MNNWIRFDGKLIKKVEGQELRALGVTDKALECNYNNSDNNIYISEDGQTIYEFMGNVNEQNLTGAWDLETFLQWFNETEV